MCGGKGGNKVSQTQTYTPDPLARSAIESAIGMGAGVAQTPFRTPVAPVAGFSQDQQRAFDITNQTQGAALPYLNTAASYFTPQGAQQFFNPMAQGVLANMQDIFGQQRSQMTGNLTQQAGGTGADRIAVGQAELAKQQGLAAGQTLSDLYARAQQAAQGAGFGMGSLGPAVQGSVLQGAQALLGTGGLQQQLQQAQMNAPYQNILQSIMWPYQNAQFYGNMVGSLAPGLGGTTSGQTTYPQQSPWGNILGMGLAGMGLYNMGSDQGWWGNSGNVAADPYVNADTDPSLIGNRGGRVPNYAEGGEVEDDFGDDQFRQAEIGTLHEAASPHAYMMNQRLPSGLSGKPVDMTPQSLIPTGQITPIKPNIPQLPKVEQGGGGKGSNLLGTAMKVLPMVLNRGGGVPHYAEGGLADPAQSAPSGGLDSWAPQPMGGQPGPADNSSGMMHALPMPQPSVFPGFGGWGGGMSTPGDPSNGLRGYTDRRLAAFRNNMPSINSLKGSMMSGAMDKLRSFLTPEAMNQLSAAKGSMMQGGGQGAASGAAPNTGGLKGSMMQRPGMGGWQGGGRRFGGGYGFAEGGEVDESLGIPDDPFERAALRVRGIRPAPGMYGAEPPDVQSPRELAGSVAESAPMLSGPVGAGLYASDKLMERFPEELRNRARQRALMGTIPGQAISMLGQATGAEAAPAPTAPAPQDDVDPEPKRTPEAEATVKALKAKIVKAKTDIEGANVRYANDPNQKAIRLRNPTRDLANAEAELNVVDGDFQRMHGEWSARNADTLRQRREFLQKQREHLARASLPFRQRDPETTDLMQKGGMGLAAVLGPLAGATAKTKLGGVGTAIAAGAPTGAFMNYLPDILDARDKLTSEAMWERMKDPMHHVNVGIGGALLDTGIAGLGGYAGTYVPKLARGLKSLPTHVAESFGQAGKTLRDYFPRAAAPGPAPAAGAAAKSGGKGSMTLVKEHPALPDGRVLKEWTDVNGNTVWTHKGRRINKSDHPFARGGAVGNPYAFDDGGEVPWAPELNDRWGAMSDPFPGEDPATYQIPKSWNATRRVSNLQAFPDEDDYSPPAAQPTTHARVSDGEVPERPSIGGHGSPGGGGRGTGKGSGMISSPWMALVNAGLGTMAAAGQRDARGLPTPPLAALGQGGLQGLGMLKDQRDTQMKQQGIDMQARRLQQAADFHNDQYTRLTAAQRMTPRKLGMDEFGRDVMGVPGERIGTWLDPFTGKPIDMSRVKLFNPEASLPATAGLAQHTFPDGATPFAVPDDASDEEKKTAANPLAGRQLNEAALEGLPKNIADQVRMIAAGKLAPPTSFAATKPYWQQMLQYARQYDPSFDAINFSARSAALKDFTSGVTARNLIRPMNTVATHLDTLDKAGQALDNFKSESFGIGTKAINTMRAWSLENKQDPRIRTFNTAATAVSNELEKAFRGNQTAISGIKEWRQSMNPAMAKDEMRAANRTLVTLLKGQLESVSDQWQRAFGTTRDPVDFMTPGAKAVFERLEKPDDVGVTKPGLQRPQSVPAGSAYSPSRKQWRGPDGKIYDAEGKPVQ